jgi:putative sterol carrier protein
MPSFLSDAWASALCARLAASDAYRAAAATWEGSLCLVATEAADAPSGAAPAGAVWLDLYHGDCRAARAVAPGTDAFVTIEASHADWQRVLAGALDPVMGVMLGKLKVRGDKGAVLRHARAARELAACAAAIDGASE